MPKIIRSIKGTLIRNSPRSHQKARIIKKFVEKLGLIYFGAVDQRVDEHHVIRGLTVSSTHRDTSYSVGSIEGYDVSLVDRHDTVKKTDGSFVAHDWLIIEVVLTTQQDIPHIFLGTHQRDNGPYQALFTAFPALQPVPVGTFEPYSPEFMSRYSLFATASHFIEVERLFPAAETRIIGAHFWPLAAEIYDGSLYIYADDQQISSRLLETMVTNGLWLARHLDRQAELV